MDTDTLLLYGSIYAWMLFTGVGLPPVPEGVAVMPSRRGQRGSGR